jgi:hypothetical protein
MSFELSPVALGTIKRNKVLPAYDFIERWVGEGSAYVIEGGGYCVVAPKECLASNFIIELSFPKINSRDVLKELMYKLTEVSSGAMWLDTGDADALELVWRMNLLLRPLSPLFAWDKTARKKLDLDGLAISPFGRREARKTMQLLTSFPADKGGLTRDEALAKMAEGLITSLWYHRKHVGSAILQPQEGNFAALTLVLEPSSRGQGFTTRFGTLIGRRLAKEGKTMLASMPNNNLASYRACVSAGMKIVKRAFVTRLVGA